MTVGEKMRETRKEKGLTQKQLAEKMKISYVNISQLERNERTPNLETLQRIAAALGVSVEVLIYGTDRTFADSDGVRYSGSYISQKEIEEGDLFDYHDNDGQRFGGSWSKRVMETLQAFPENERQNILEYIELRRQQIQKGDNVKGEGVKSAEKD